MVALGLWYASGTVKFVQLIDPHVLAPKNHALHTQHKASPVWAERTCCLHSHLLQVLPEFMTSGPSEDSTKDASGKDQHAMAVVRQITPEALLAQCAGLAVVEITFLCGSVAWQVQEHPLLTRCWGVFPVLGLAWCLGQGAQFMNLLGYEVNIQRPKMRVSLLHH